MGKIDCSSYFFGIISFNKKCGKFFWRKLLSYISLNILGGWSGNFIFSFWTTKSHTYSHIQWKRKRLIYILQIRAEKSVRQWRVFVIHLRWSKVDVFPSICTKCWEEIDSYNSKEPFVMRCQYIIYSSLCATDATLIFEYSEIKSE